MVNLGGAKMAKSVGNTLMVSEVVKRVPPIALRYYLLAAHYRSIIEFSEESLAEAAVAWDRIEGFVRRAVEVVGPVEPSIPCADFVHAMDDDLSIPAALAAIQGVIAEGHKALADGNSEVARGAVESVRAMLAVLGLDPLAEPWASRGSSRADEALGSLVEGLLEQRQAARAAKDFAAADVVRDQLAAAGIEIEDTPQGPRWSVS
jgi:cysteinyl-tRNA synthetase